MRRYFIFFAFCLAQFLVFQPQLVLAANCKCYGTFSSVENGTRVYQCYDAPDIATCNTHNVTNQNTGIQTTKCDFISDQTFTDQTCTAPKLYVISKSCKLPSDCQVSPCQEGLTDCQAGTCYVDAEIKQCWDNVNAGGGRQIKFLPPVLEIKIPGVDMPTNAITLDDQGFLTVPYLVDYIKAIYKFLVIAASIVAAVVIILNGFRITMSAGGEEKGEGIKRVGQAVIGLFIMWSSYAILYTLNPALTQLKPIRVKYITPVIDDLEYDTPTDPTVETVTRPGVSTNVTPLASTKYSSLDELFQTYGDCVDEDWRALKALAWIESKLDPNALNPSNKIFAGLFQTITKYANPFVAPYGKNFGNPADFEANKNGKIPNPALFDPENSTMVGTLMYMNSDRIIKKYCDVPSMTPENYFYFIYVGHQSGPGALNYILSKIKDTNNGQCVSSLASKYDQEYYTNHNYNRSAAEVTAESEKGNKYVEKIKEYLGMDKNSSLDWKTVQQIGDPNFICPL